LPAAGGPSFRIALSAEPLFDRTPKVVPPQVESDHLSLRIDQEDRGNRLDVKSRTGLCVIGSVEGEPPRKFPGLLKFGNLRLIFVEAEAEHFEPLVVVFGIQL